MPVNRPKVPPALTGTRNLLGSAFNTLNRLGMAPPGASNLRDLFIPVREQITETQRNVNWADAGIQDAYSELNRAYENLKTQRFPLHPELLKLESDNLRALRETEKMADFFRTTPPPQRMAPQLPEFPQRPQIPLPDLTPSTEARRDMGVAAGLVSLFGGGAAVPALLDAALREDEKLDQARRMAYQLAVQEAERQYEADLRKYAAEAEIARDLSRLQFENEKEKFAHALQAASYNATNAGVKEVLEGLGSDLDAHQRYQVAMDRFKSALERFHVLSNLRGQYKREYTELFSTIIALDEAYRRGDLTQAQALLSRATALSHVLNSVLAGEEFPYKARLLDTQAVQNLAHAGMLTAQAEYLRAGAKKLIEELKTDVKAGKSSAELLDKVTKNFDTLAAYYGQGDYEKMLQLEALAKAKEEQHKSILNDYNLLQMKAELAGQYLNDEIDVAASQAQMKKLLEQANEIATEIGNLRAQQATLKSNIARRILNGLLGSNVKGAGVPTGQMTTQGLMPSGVSGAFVLGTAPGTTGAAATTTPSSPAAGVSIPTQFNFSSSQLLSSQGGTGTQNVTPSGVPGVMVLPSGSGGPATTPFSFSSSQLRSTTTRPKQTPSTGKSQTPTSFNFSSSQLLGNKPAGTQKKGNQPVSFNFTSSQLLGNAPSASAGTKNKQKAPVSFSFTSSQLLGGSSQLSNVLPRGKPVPSLSNRKKMSSTPAGVLIMPGQMDLEKILFQQKQNPSAASKKKN